MMGKERGFENAGVVSMWSRRQENPWTGHIRLTQARQTKHGLAPGLQTNGAN